MAQQSYVALEKELKRYEAVVEAAKRLVFGYSYVHWTRGGGPNECEHGIADGICCVKCDTKLLESISALESTKEEV